MKRATGSIVLGLSACGYPLTQLVVRRRGRYQRYCGRAEPLPLLPPCQDIRERAFRAPPFMLRVPFIFPLGLCYIPGGRRPMSGMGSCAIYSRTVHSTRIVANCGAELPWWLSSPRSSISSFT